ncbi:hypothetical protein J2Y73_004530 [Peribacillus frigoritolerans]|nr:hypothetical protein [Peribacillus frigoritolerans]
MNAQLYVHNFLGDNHKVNGIDILPPSENSPLFFDLA